ncbi:TonB-dependent receptor domain-containing protein [Pelistega ratti]|uniref:TonB-dependent receptor domain-containing protein n=1 Tax=Pelistega ratti TaxID=2652177 RepID=UPI001358D004|nr:TonB-dependent receptor [Pelistega ratti]
MNRIKQKYFPPKLLCVVLANLFLPLAQVQAQQALDEISVVSDVEKTADEKGKDNVYRKNVSNEYISQEELKHYRIESAGDILKGLNGVYNMNSRTAGGAVTPNIRGIMGKGRIPFTIDGTEQTVDVWMNNYGVSERNYVDPNLFRSISVEKGPSLTRHMKPGIGGSVAVRTIEPEDIIQEGKSWGLQVNVEGSGNKADYSGSDLSRYLGKDYRSFNATADGPGGGADPLTGARSPFGVVLDDLKPPKHKTSSDTYKFKNDMSYMVAAGVRSDYTDFLAAYSIRDKGNYFSGKKGAHGYLNNPVYDADTYYGCGYDCRKSDAFIPNMAKMYKPGEEVLNSHVRSETTLLKNNWYLPNNHKISLEYMRNKIRFGEINPFDSSWVLNVIEHNPNYNGKNINIPQTRSIASELDNKMYKIGYDWKPDNHPWIDLSANLWRVKTNSSRHQSGGASLAVKSPDQLWDAWYSCTKRNELPTGAQSWAKTCQDVANAYGFDLNMNRDDILKLSKEWGASNENGEQNIIAGALQKTNVTRTGFDISNVFKINDKLSITLGGDYQREKLEEKNTVVNSQDIFNMLGMVSGLTKLAGPRGGKRTEWGINLSAQWKPTSRLTVDAGVRYQKFSAEDTILANERKKRNPWAAFGHGVDDYITGIGMRYGELVRDKEIVDLLEEDEKLFKKLVWDEKNFTEQDAQRRKELGSLLVQRGYRSAQGSGRVFYNYKIEYFPYENRKVDLSQSKMTPENLRKKVNHEGKEVHQYAFGMSEEEIERFLNSTSANDVIASKGLPTRELKWADRNSINHIIQPITEEMRWAPPPKLKGEAWSPMLGLSYQVGDNHTLFARYAEMRRFPSIYEMNAMNSTGTTDHPLAPMTSLKPEISRNIEIGWAFNWAPYIKGMKYGDIRLTYYDNHIKNVIDTTDHWNIVQYDKRKTKGVELHSRFDTGRFFGSLGGTYRLEQKTCDRSTTMQADMIRYRIPTCIEGSFGNSRFNKSLLPKYSINAELGARLLNKSLELGVRAIYHSSVETKEFNKMVRRGLDGIYVSTGKPYHWRPQLLVDIYGQYQVNNWISVKAGVTNITNRYYLDPMSNVAVPGPGRTLTLGVNAQF